VAERRAVGDVAATNRVWFVRAGSRGSEIRSFLDDGFVGVAWGETGALTGLTELRAFEERLIAVYPTRSRRTLTAWAAMLRAITSTMAVGDDVMTIESDARRYWLGKVASEYRWEQNAQLAHRRSVRWSGSIARAPLTEATQRCLGAISTVFRLSADATQEVLKTLRTLGAPTVPGRRTQRTSNG
jgi:restriction system protein